MDVERVNAYECNTYQYKDIPENSRYNHSLMTLHSQGTLEDKTQQTYYHPKRTMDLEDIAAMTVHLKNGQYISMYRVTIQ